MNLLPADIVIVYGGMLWMLSAPFVWAYHLIMHQGKLWTWGYHIMMGWDGNKDNVWKCLSMEPPVLKVTTIHLDYVKVGVWRLKDRPDDIDDRLYAMFNEQLGKSVYGLWDECPDIVQDFYKKEFGIDLGSTIASIEDVCKTNSRFMRVR